MNLNVHHTQSTMNNMDMMSFDVHMFVMIHLGSILLFLILLAVAIPVLTFIFHTMFESYKKRRDEAGLRDQEAKSHLALTTVIVRKNKKSKFIHSFKSH